MLGPSAIDRGANASSKAIDKINLLTTKLERFKLFSNQ
jgi:hypothetical protein